MSTRYTAPGEPGPYPLTVAEVKVYLKIDIKSDDDVITLLIQAATQFAETYTGRDLRTRTWTATLDRFKETHSDRIELRRNQIGVINFVKYFNDETTPVLTTVDAADYYLKKEQWWSYVVLKAFSSWPADVDGEQEEQRITVEFITILPVNFEEIKVALLRILAAMYEDRGDCGGCSTSAQAAMMASMIAGPFLTQFRIPRI